MSKRIAVVGFGNVGEAISKRLENAGFEVVVSARDLESTRSSVAEAGLASDVANTADAVDSSDVVFLAVPAMAVEGFVAEADLSGKVVIDATNPLRFDGGPIWNPPAEGSMAELIAARAPDAHVVKAFNTFGAEYHAAPETPAGPVSLYFATDSSLGRSVVTEISEECGFAPVDAGPLRNAGPLENMAILWIHMALVGGHGRNKSFQWVARDVD